MSKVELTLEETVELQQGLSVLTGLTENIEYKQKLVDSKKSSSDEIFTLGYLVSKFNRKIKEHIEDYNTEKSKLLKQYGIEILDKEGNRTNKFNIKVEDQENYEKALRVLNNTKVTLQDVSKISLATLKKFGVGGIVLTTCAPIIRFDIAGIEADNNSPEEIAN